MKRSITFILIILLVATLFLFAQGGSESDPLVTLSYVEKRLSELKAEINGASTGEQNNTEASNSKVAIFDVYEYPEGTRLAFGASTEFIVRRGKAEVFDPYNNNIPDLTSGVDVKKGTLVPLNHHMLVPREDGRGIIVKESIWIMIKGSFVIIE